MMDDFTESVFKKSLDFKSDKIEAISLSVDFAYQQIRSKSYQDLANTFVVAVAVWIYMAIYMRSLFLSTTAILTIGFSIPVSMVIYK